MGKQLKQKAMVGPLKPFVYLYMILYIFIVYLAQMLTFRMNPVRFTVFMIRLLHLVKTIYPNKVMRVDGKYKFQLYLPAFPSRAFFHAMNKFDPANKNPGPMTVVFSMTKACPYKCEYCYQKNDSGPELDMEQMKDVAKQMQEIGVSMFDIEGGEPLARFDRMLDLLSAFDDRAELWMNTTGFNLTEEQVVKLKDAGLYGVMISLHTADREKYEKFNGFKGSYDMALNAFPMFQKHGIVTAINFCPTIEEIHSGGVEALIGLAAKQKATMVQVIHAKPSGGWLYEEQGIYMNDELLDKLHGFHYQFNDSSKASQFPSVLFQVFEEDEKSFGCTAGGIDRFYFNHEGEVQPCEFINVSFGNVKDEPFIDIFNRMRSYFQTPGEKWLCCTEAHSIGKAIKENDLKKTPLPKNYTEEIVKNWDKGKPTKIYKNLGIYKK